ncbi:RNHCP domain-containing protein [Spirochaeta isovalerica]|uniref:DNA-directed RNA polymerase subunit RPC12/RpoP n=1 Tax=Spirochaeta isovalerica TaxID=150 RepID=A0A841R3X5_9SPIO|nr:RNHCP domain-containing protein [Spirochaeta isovalerica]MBB6478503.1 DNA-directed RNA polymerase subunit RPC12/RpoP [Spirochaeta isovalerica]
MSRQKKNIINYNETFICGNCGRTVSPQESGGEHRNHCPYCLWSRHMDLKPGDRRSGCRSLMEPIALWVRRDGEWAIVHRCSRCGFIRTNRIAGDDSEILLFSMAARAMTMLPFPVEKTLTNIHSICVEAN